MKPDNPGNACRFAEQAPLWLLGELSPEDASAFEAHLASCPECAGRVEDYRAISDRLKSVGEVPLQRDLAPLVLKRLEKMGPGPYFSPRRLRVVTLRILAAAALVLVGVGLMMRFAGKTGPGPIIPPTAAESPAASALEWLARAQDASGAWKPAAFGGSDGQTLGVTALSVYAFLKHPDLATGRYADTVARGVDYLIAHQRPDGYIGVSSTGLVTREHALATLALARASATLGDTRVRASADAAVALIRRAQSENGSWGRVADSAADTSVTVWQLHALVEAEAGGWKGLRPSIDRGLEWLTSARLAEGRAAYARAGSFPYGTRTESEAGRLFLLADTRGGRDDAKYFRESDPLRLYFLTRGLDSLGGDEASHWAGMIRSVLASRQVKRGVNAGSWDASDPAGGRVSSTALAALSFR